MERMLIILVNELLKKINCFILLIIFYMNKLIHVYFIK